LNRLMVEYFPDNLLGGLQPDLGDRNQPRGPRLQRIETAPFVPTIVKKRQEDVNVDNASSGAVPEK